MVVSIVELVLALICLGIAGHLIIRLWDNQRGQGRRHN